MNRQRERFDGSPIRTELETIEIKVVQQALESNLIILSPNPNSDSVADLIDELHWVLEDLSVDSTLSLEELGSLIKENKYEEAEKKKEREIYNSVKKIYLKTQKYLDE